MHLAGGDFMSRVGLEARVPDALNHIRGLGFEPFGHLQGVGTVALDAQIQGLQPRMSSQESNGEGTAPAAFCRKATFSRVSSSLTTTAPPTTSEWPPMYLVVE